MLNRLKALILEHRVGQSKNWTALRFKICNIMMPLSVGQGFFLCNALVVVAVSRCVSDSPSVPGNNVRLVERGRNPGKV